MERVLLVSGSADGKEILRQLIREAGYTTVTATGSGNEARRLTACDEYGIIVINTPLTDEFGREFAVKAAESTNSGIVLICRSDISEELTDKLSCHGIFVLSKPADKNTFIHTLELVSATRSRMLRFNSNSKLQSKAEEVKLINRAKNCLMQYLKFSEPQAHRYIEKQAMDTRQTRKDVARHILSIYEN
ncbi:MAG: ANTAR domain-containing protein [Ruminococcus sp.]|nr:ANTAR domain-containing protein [Ruminococcus sp.]